MYPDNPCFSEMFYKLLTNHAIQSRPSFTIISFSNSGLSIMLDDAIDQTSNVNFEKNRVTVQKFFMKVCFSHEITFCIRMLLMSVTSP